MILLNDRAEHLKTDAITCIKNFLASNAKIMLVNEGFTDYLDNSGEDQYCDIKSIEKRYDKELYSTFVVIHTGRLNECDDECDLDDLSLETLCSIGTYFQKKK